MDFTTTPEDPHTMNPIRLLPLLLLAVIGCTDNTSARSYGGTASMPLPCGEKLVTATWKEASLWYLTRPMRDDETPETYTFREDSSLGLVEGTVILKECR